MDYRGRGKSAYDPSSRSYTPQNYIVDIHHLLALTGCHKVIVIGTSLGGGLAMIMGTAKPTALAGVVLNDIGPQIDTAGIARISGYLGNFTRFESWGDAAQSLATEFASSFPDFMDEDWLAEAHNSYKADANGKIVLNYDPNIAKSFEHLTDTTNDLSRYFLSLTPFPVLALRGELSDLLSKEVFTRMQDQHPNLTAVTVPKRGHAPTLNEDIARTAIDAFIAKIDDAQTHRV